MSHIETKVHELQFHAEKVMRARAEYMEMYCAAFLREVGAGSVLDYELVEQHELCPEEDVIQRVTWRFQKKGSSNDFIRQI